MPSLVDAITGNRRAFLVGPRSVVPGRQRWDVGVVRGRPRVAALLETALRESPGIGMVRANPVTGRLLVYHDAALSSGDVNLLVRQAVALALPQTAMAPPRSSRRERSALPGRARHWRLAVPSLIFAGTPAALTLALVERSLRPSPLAYLRAVLGVAMQAARRIWRRFSRAQQVSTVPVSSTGHSLLQVVGSQALGLYLSPVLSALGQVPEVALFCSLAGAQPARR